MAKSLSVTSRAYKRTGTKFTLPAGSYVVKASYYGFGKVEAIRDINIVAGENREINLGLPIGMFKPKALLSGNNLQHIRNISWSIISKNSISNNDNRKLNLDNDKPIAMAPGDYILNTHLGNIKQHSHVRIRHGEMTSHSLILRGGIVSARVWHDRNKTLPENQLSVSIYTHADYYQKKVKGKYVPKVYQSGNILSASTILAEGNYVLQVTEPIHHKKLLTKDIEVNDGDKKIIQLVLPE